MFYADTLHIDWREVIDDCLDKKDQQIIILNRRDLDVYFGPILKLLLNGVFPV